MSILLWRVKKSVQFSVVFYDAEAASALQEADGGKVQQELPYQPVEDGPHGGEAEADQHGKIHQDPLWQGQVEWLLKRWGTKTEWSAPTRGDWWFWGNWIPRGAFGGRQHWWKLPQLKEQLHRSGRLFQLGRLNTELH